MKQFRNGRVKKIKKKVASRKGKPTRMTLGPVFFFIAICVLAAVFGIWINDNLHAREVTNPAFREAP